MSRLDGGHIIPVVECGCDIFAFHDAIWRLGMLLRLSDTWASAWRDAGWWRRTEAVRAPSLPVAWLAQRAAILAHATAHNYLIIFCIISYRCLTTVPARHPGSSVCTLCSAGSYYGATGDARSCDNDFKNSGGKLI